MTKKERELLIEIMTNVDDVLKVLTKEQRDVVKNCVLKIFGNYLNLLDGVK